MEAFGTLTHINICSNQVFFYSPVIFSSLDNFGISRSTQFWQKSIILDGSTWQISSWNSSLNKKFVKAVPTTLLLGDLMSKVQAKQWLSLLDCFRIAMRSPIQASLVEPDCQPNKEFRVWINTTHVYWFNSKNYLLLKKEKATLFRHNSFFIL